MLNGLPQDSDSAQINNFLRTGNIDYFNQLYDRYANLVFRKCLSFLKSPEDAQDAAQEIWVKVYFSLAKFENKARFSTWLFRITTNHCINHLRQRRVFVSLDFLTQSGFEVKAPHDLFNAVSAESSVTKALAHLSKDIRALLLLKYVEGYTYQEIAQITGLGVSNVKMRISRAKEYLGNLYLNNS